MSCFLSRHRLTMLMITKGGEDNFTSNPDSDELEVSSETRGRPLMYQSYAKAMADAQNHSHNAKVKYVLQTSESSDDDSLSDVKRNRLSCNPTAPSSSCGH